MTPSWWAEGHANITDNDLSNGLRVMLTLVRTRCDSIWLFQMHPPLSLVSINMPYRLQKNFKSLGLMEWWPLLIFRPFQTLCDSIRLLQCILLCLLYLLTCLIDSRFLTNLWNLWNDGPCWYSVLSKHNATLFDSCNASSSVSPFHWWFTSSSTPTSFKPLT